MTRQFLVKILGLLLFACQLNAHGLAQEIKIDPSRLVHPEVADRLSLTDVQRAKIQQLLIDRATALAAAADDAAKLAVRQDFDAQAIDLLTDQQKERLQEDRPSEKLMFQFREMKWDHVLSWFATQQDLTLVMDRTPPGAFTYSDSRSYSASEALDLLNSVLMTRGFTLVRREKMLTVMELSDAIPMELIPRITLDQLPQRGRFELVSIEFPLAKRPVEAVIKEVKPYLSNYGKALPLAAGSVLLVIETAGKMQTINELIAAVPVPQAPAAPVAPPTPVFAAYALGQLNPDTTLEFIRKLIPSENISVDGQAGILSAFVIPDQQTAIKAAFDALNEKQAALPELESVAYSLEHISAKELKSHIESLAPTAKTVASTDRVLVAASPGDQRLIKDSLAELDVSPIDSSKQTRTVQVEPAQVTEIEKALLSFLPRVQVVSNATTGSILLRGSEIDLKSATDLVQTWTRPQELQKLQIYTLTKQQAQRRATLTNLPPWLSDLKVVPGGTNQELYVWATAEQHEQFASLLKLLDQPALPESSKLPQLYSIMAQNTAMVVELLTADFPDAKFTVSEDALQITALADPALQPAIKTRIDQLNESLPPRVDAKLEVYKVPGMAPATLQQSLASVLTKATVQVDSAGGRLLVWAKPSEHQKIAELVKVYTVEPGTQVKLPQVYSIMAQNTAMVVELLTADFQDAKFTISEDALQVTALADPALQPAIKTRIDQLNESLPPRVDAKLEVYKVPGMAPATLQQSLASVLTKATVQVDSAGGRLLVWAKPSEHQKIAELVKVLSTEVAVDQQKVVVVYPVEFTSATLAKTVLDQLDTDAKIVADEKLKQLVVTATLTEQATFQATIKQMDRASATAEGPEMRGFDVKTYQANQILPTLQSIWPTMKIAADTVSNKILATGTAQELKQLETALGQLITSPGGKVQIVKTYPVPVGDMVTLPTILSQIAPQATFSTDVAARTITALASDELHERIGAALQQITTVQSTKRPATHQVKPSQLSSLQTALLTLFPGVSVATDASSGQLIVVASEQVQAQVAEVVQLLAAGPNADSRTVQVFALETDRFDAVSFLLTLQSLVPAPVKLEAHAASNSILSIGTSGELEEVAKQVEQLKQRLPQLPTSTMHIYKLKHGSLTSAMTMLQSLIPKATMVPDVNSRSLAVSAKEQDHRKIVEFLQQFDLPPQAKTYAVRPSQLAAIQTSLRTLFPTLEMTGDSTTGQLVILAAEATQQQVAQIVELLGKGAPGVERTIQAHTLDPQRFEVASFMTTLQSLVPATVKLESNTSTNSVLAIGSEEELQLVAQQVEKLKQQIPIEQSASAKLYQLQHANPTSVSTMLLALAPKAKIVPDIISRSIVATANDAEHQKIATFLQQWDVAPTAQSYVVKPTQTTAVLTSLRALFPTVEMTSDATSGQIVVVAPTPVQERVAQVVQLLASGPNTAERTVQVFPLKPRMAETPSFLKSLQALCPPHVQLEINPLTNSLVAIGTADELKIVQKQVQELIDKIPEPATQSSALYQLKHATTLSAITVLQPLVPKAILVQDSATRSLAATATAEEHSKIAELVKVLDQPAQTNQTTKVYQLKSGSGQGLAYVLTGIMPDAKLFGDRESGAMLATATEQQHEVIRAIVEQYGDSGQFQTRVFSIERGDARSLQAAIAEWNNRVKVTADRGSNSLIVTASEEELKRIEGIVSGIEDSGTGQQETRFYAVRGSSPTTLASALQLNFPKASIAGDPSGGGIFVTGTPATQLQVQQVVDQVNSSPNRQSNLRAFHIQHIPPPEVARSLVEALGKRSTASVTLNEDTRSVFVVGIAEDHQLAEEIVKLVDVPRHERIFRQLKVFPVDGLDGKTLMDALNAAFHDEPDRVELRHDFSTGRLYVFGNPSQLARADQMLETLTPEPRSLHVVALGAQDPYSTKEAIEALFTDTPYNRSPLVTVDADHQRLLIKATADQQTQIRNLLSQLGATASFDSTSLEDGQGSGEIGRIRLVPSVGDSARLLDQLRSIWPALSPNPLKIVQPQQSDVKSVPGSEAESEEPDQNDKNPSSDAQQNLQPDLDSGASTQSDQPAAVVIVVGKDQWTLASEDIQALEQLERVLNVIRNPRAQPILSTGNYSLYLLQRTSAKEMESTLESLLKPNDQRSSRSVDALRRLKVVADERTNALIVSGSAADRRLVEELLGVLDSEELLGRIQSMQPTTIVLESANAERVESLLKDIYRSQLSTSSSRRPLPIPEGVSSEVATLLQQLNAQSSGPLVTITADEPTNSIIIRAPRDLTAEIQQFVQSLDQQTADTPSRRVELIRLHSSNVKSIEQALRRLLVK
jgi:type II secretory pathway component GspD/PulD (secretin)